MFTRAAALAVALLCSAASASRSHAADAAAPSASGTAPADPQLTLRYDRPARQWVEALPIGNGRMGAMVFGGAEQEHLQLNEDTLYSGEPPADLRTLDISKSLPEVVAMIRANKHAEADAYVMKHWLGRNQQCYQPLGDLFLDFAASGPAAGGPVSDYRR